MGRALWLPDALRGAGLTVTEVSGWKTRGGDTFNPVGVVCHATAGSRTATDQGEINVLLNGSTSAPPPIAQLYLGREGHWWVVASGRCNHVKTGFGGTRFAGTGNSNLIGIEAANDNRGEPWPAVQYESYARGVAAIVRWNGWPLDRVVGHKEHQPGDKTDPTFPMNPFRTRVTQILAGATTTAGDEMDAQQEAKVIQGSLTPDNAMYYWLRAVSGKVPTITASGDLDWEHMVDAPEDWPLMRALKAIEKLGQGQQAIIDRLNALESTPGAGATPDQVEAAVKQALREGTD